MYIEIEEVEIEKDRRQKKKRKKKSIREENLVTRTYNSIPRYVNPRNYVLPISFLRSVILNVDDTGNAHFTMYDARGTADVFDISENTIL